MGKSLGFLWRQPIYRTLRQLRVYTVCMLLVSIDIMYRLIGILEKGETVAPEQTIGVVGTLAIAVFASIWKGLASITEQCKQDE